MVLKAEQDKLKKLLGEAIPLLCKNGIQFKSEFSIEALIGITLDRDQVLLVSINETVRSEQAAESDEDAERLPTSTANFTDPGSSVKSRQKCTENRKRRKCGMGSRSSSPDPSSPSSSKQPRHHESCSDQIIDSESTNEQTYETKPNVHRVNFDPSEVSVKLEPEDDVDDDLIFIKEDSSSDVDLSGILPFDQQHQGIGDMSFPHVPDGQATIQGVVPVAGYPNAAHVAAEGDSQGYHLGEPSTSQQVCLAPQ